MVRYLESVRDERLRQLREQRLADIMERLPKGCDRAALEQEIAAQVKERTHIIWPIAAQIHRLGAAFGYMETTKEALIAVAVARQDNPNLTPDAYRWRPSLFNRTPPGRTEGIKLLYASTQYAKEIFELYEREVLPELIPSDSTRQSARQ